jgi:hypothetical protein
MADFHEPRSIVHYEWRRFGSKLPTTICNLADSGAVTNGSRNLEACGRDTLLLRNAVLASAENPRVPITLFIRCLSLLEGRHQVSVSPETLTEALLVTESMEQLELDRSGGATPGHCFGEICQVVF